MANEMKRYEQLNWVIESVRPKSIIEVGTWSGDRAIQMISSAKRFNDEISYTGFDLFEDITPEINEIELNVKKAFSFEEVSKKIQAGHPDATVKLVRGNTRDTLPKHNLDAPPDFVFLDGGHSLDTIQSDWNALKDAKCIVLDDYYTADDEGRCPDTSKYGCNKIADEIGARLLPQKDPVLGGGYVQMAVYPPSSVKQKLKVQPKNCVQDDTILENIKYHLNLDLEEFQPCRRHSGVAVMCAAGPSLKEQIANVKKLQDIGGKVVCVKNSHDLLIDNGVIPWACVLLDPRGHVAEFVKNPHPRVNYFVASMCAPSTVEQLLKHKAKVYLYHAAVGAGEQDLLAGKNLICGGVSAAMRGISLFYAMGFYRFRLFGYDLCYSEKPEKFDMTGSGENQYWRVEIAGKKFHVDSEKVAQAQDFQNIVKQERELDIQSFGEPSIITHILQAIEHKRAPEFKSLYG